MKNKIWSLSLDAEQGGSVVSGLCKGYKVFEPARPNFQTKGDVFASSCFPLVPFSNRIADGKFSFEGQQHSLVSHYPNLTIPIHGNGWQNLWGVTQKSKISCTMGFSYQPVPGDWPWSFDAQQTVELLGESVKFHLSIRNTDRTAFPAGIGLHPFFANTDKARIKFEARKMWECRDDLIPTHQISLFGKNDFSSARAIKDSRLDNCFEGWDGRSVIGWSDADFMIELTADPIFSNLVVYIQPENGFFCLEPVSHVNNALNMTGKNAMSVLKPGEIQEGIITLKAVFQ